jgi:hypothetical protein
MSADGKTGDQLVEDGIALIARGMFRVGHADGGNNPKEASDMGLAAVSVIREMALDFLKRAQR